MIELLRKLFCNCTPEPTSPPDAPSLDDVLRSHAKRIPFEMLKALAYSESRLNPRYELEKEIDVDTRRYASGKKDTYWGLFQVGLGNVLADYNKRHRTDIKPVELFDPDTNTRLAVDTLERIVRAYEETYVLEGINNLHTDWGSAEFVRLVVAGWNSGYSRAGGVQRVAKWLAARKIKVTHDNVFAYAKRAGGTKFLDVGQYKKKRDWQRKVVKRYFTLKSGGSL